MFGGYFSSMEWNRFKVYVKDGFLPHFKMALKSFDSDAIIKDKISYLFVETKVDWYEISGFTSVKRVEKINFEEE